MHLRNDTRHWGAISIALHWLTVVLIIGLGTLGLVMTELPTSPLKISLYALHKSFGLTVLALTVLRLLWRFYAGAPDAVPGMPRWQARIAHAVHGALYTLLLAIPLSGWLFNSAAGFPLRWFGLFSLPKLSHYDKTLKAFAHETHETLFYVLAALLLAHAGAALVHHYRDRDATLARMWPWAKPR